MMKRSYNGSVLPTFLRSIALVMASVMFFVSLPVYAFAQLDIPEEIIEALGAAEEFSHAPTSKPSGPSLADLSEEATYAPPAESIGPAEHVQTDEPGYDESATQVRELLAERTETAKIYELSDGAREAIVGVGPVHYQDQQDRYIDIATNLVPSRETSTTFGGFAPLSTREGMEFSAFGDDGAAIIQGDGWKVSLTYAGATTTVPLAFGDTAYYTDVAPGVDLEYRSMWWGIKETLILTQPTDEHTFDFRLTFEGLELAYDEESTSYRLIDPETGEAVLEIGRLIVTDNFYDEEKGEFIACEDVYWEAVDGGEGWATLRAVIDRDWIQDNTRVWPVRIDPPVILSGIAAAGGLSHQDTYTSSRYPTTSYQWTHELKIGYYDSSTGHNRALTMFVLPNLKGMRIERAELHAQQFHQYYVNAATTTYVAELDRNPSVYDTWNTMPGVVSWIAASTTTTIRNQPVVFNLKNYMQARINGGNTPSRFTFYQDEGGSQNTTHWRKYYSEWSGVTQSTFQVRYRADIKAVTGLKATTKASAEWFKEVDHNNDGIADNRNDRDGQGRGIINLSWNADPNAKGYLVYTFDGNAYNIVGKTVGPSATTWSSEGSGIFPTDSEIDALKQNFAGHSYIYGNTPSDESRLARTTLTYPSAVGSNPAGAGVVAFDGTDMYVKKWSSYPGPDQWVQFKKTGMTNGLPTYGTGKKIATTQAGTTSLSAFVKNGVLYDGYVTRVGGGTADIQGFVLSSIMDKAVPTTLTLSKPPFGRGSGAEVTGPTNGVLLAADDTHIYSAARVSSTSPNIKVRIYDEHGVFIEDKTYSLAGQSPYLNFDGVTSDGSNLYFYEWGGAKRMTKVSLKTGKVVNQWHVDRQPTDRSVSVVYDKVHNRFVMGQLDNLAAVHSFRGIGVDFRDDPRPLYRKTANNRQYDNNKNYWFKVCPYSEHDAIEVGTVSSVQATFENRTIRVSDVTQRSFVPIVEIAHETVEGALSSSETRLMTVDLAIASAGPDAVLSRTYTSDSDFESAYLPKGWMFGFEENISLLGDATIYTSSDGNSYSFTKTQDGRYISPNGMQAELVYYEESDGCGDSTFAIYELKFPDGGLKIFDGHNGKLLYEEDRQQRYTNYDIRSNAVSILAHNGQSIELNITNTGTIEAVYETDAGTREINYIPMTSMLSVCEYPGTEAQLTRLYVMDDQRLTNISAAGDSVEIEYLVSSLSAEHTASDAPSQRHTLAYVATADPSTKRTILSKGSVTPEGEFAAGHERSEYLINVAQQVIWSSISSGADEGVYVRYNSENQLIGTQAPTVAEFPNNKVAFGRKSNTTQITEELFTYDGRGNLLSSTNKAGGLAEHFYNHQNDIIKTIDEGRGVTWFAYDNEGRLIVEEKLIGTSGEKSRTEYEYNADSKLVKTRRAIREVNDAYEWETILYGNHAPNGLPQQTIYKDVQLSAQTMPQDIAQIDLYDGFGNLVEQIMPLGTTTQATYDIVGRPITQTDPGDVTTHIKYDSTSRVTETYKTAGNNDDKHEWIVETYDVMGNNVLSKLLAPGGEELSRTDRTFDVLGREIAHDSSDIEGIETIEYDDVGNVVAVSEESVHETVFDLTQYDCLNRPIRENNTKLSFQGKWHEYDDSNNVVWCAHAGVLFETTFDSAGRVIKHVKLQSETNPVPATTTQISYNANNKPVKVTEKSADPKEPVVEYTHTYDLLEREVAVQLTGQAASTTTYNTLGWILAQTDFDGVTTAYSYNERGDVIESDHGGLITTANYDSAGRLTQSVQDDGTAIEYTYDNLGRLVREVHIGADTVLKETETTYDAKGQVASAIEHVGGWVRDFAYERVGAGESAYLKTTYTDTFANGVQATHEIHSDEFAYGLLAVSGDTTQTASLATAVTRDEVGRTVSRIIGVANHLLSYSSVGHLAFDSALSQTGSTTYTYASDNKLTGTNYTWLEQSAAYGYNVNRSELKTAKIGADIADTYAFDISKNLTEIFGGPSTAHYTYDNMGRVASKTAVEAAEIELPTKNIAVEDNNATLTYGQNWVRANSTALSGGTCTRTDVAGSELTFAFTGNELRFIGALAPTHGEFDLYLDGETTPRATISSHGPNVVYQQEIGRVTDLNQGFHTARIVSKTNARVHIDRIDIYGTSPSLLKWENKPELKIESDNSLITKRGNWTTTTSSVLSGGSSLRAQTHPGAEMTFQVAGTEVVFFGATNAHLGSFEVYIDDAPAPAATFSSATSSSVLYQRELGRVTFPQGTHTVKIRTRTPDLVEIDRIEVIGAPAAVGKWETNASQKIEAESSGITKKGTWTQSSNPVFSGGVTVRSVVAGSEITFSVTGREVVFYGMRNTNLGSFDVFLNGSTTPATTISNVGPSLAYHVPLGRISFPQGTHTIRLRTNSTELVDIDRIEVYTSKTAPVGEPITTNYTYDELGRRTSAEALDEVTTYEWNGSRLTGVVDNERETAYIYDGGGQRLRKTIEQEGVETTTSYVYDGLRLLALEAFSADSTQTLTYLYADSTTPIGALYQSYDVSEDTFFEIVSDRRGDVRELRDTSGSAFARYDYDAYGNIRTEEVMGTTLIAEELAQVIADLQPLRYAGYVWDAEAGLYYCSQRYYDPTIAAFISKDPIKADGELSAYAYCVSEPINNVDPDGLFLKAVGNWISNLFKPKPKPVPAYKPHLVFNGNTLSMKQGQTVLKSYPATTGNSKLSYTQNNGPIPPGTWYLGERRMNIDRRNFVICATEWRIQDAYKHNASYGELFGPYVRLTPSTDVNGGNRDMSAFWLHSYDSAQGGAFASTLGCIKLESAAIQDILRMHRAWQPMMLIVEY
ncbi:MAG: DNRLRE domain-containing protein [Coriobacteriia bacterium]|nr:DNRLRE domain-containing protein [Coriobacteriia bacterium]